MQQAGQARAVFVDPTGRRSRRVGRACWILGALGVAYVALVLVSLLLPPGLSRLTVPGLGSVLPGPAAAPLGQVQGEQAPPDVLLAPSSRVSASPTSRPSPTASSRPAPVATAPVATAPAGPPTRTASPAATAVAPTQRPTAAPGRPTAAPGRPTAAPTRGTTAPTTPPGQSSRAPRPRPSPTRGPR